MTRHCMCGCIYLEAECPNCNKITDKDRIEALTKERDRWKDACRSASRDLNIVVPDNDRLKSERDAAEAKLAAAVDWFETIRDRAKGDYMAHTYYLDAIAALTTIKGESHE